MPFKNPTELLDHLLAGNRLSLDDLRHVITAFRAESNYHEFKPPSWAAPDRGDSIRQYVTSFLNGDGGVLFVGITEGDELPDGKRGPRQIEGCLQIKGTPLTSWATTLLHGYAGKIVPGPRISEVEVSDDKNVLCIAVARAPALVPYKGDEYWLRSGDSTVKVAPYLLSDLVLGRRQHPMFRLVSVTTRYTDPKDVDLVNGKRFQIPWSVELENTSLIWADTIRAGVISWSLEPAASGIGEDDEIMRHIDAAKPTDVTPFGESLVLLHNRNTRTDNIKFKLDPFERSAIPTLGLSNVWLPPRENRTDRTLRSWAALYVLPKGSPPIWFQLRCEYSYDDLGRKDGKLSCTWMQCAPGERPYVTLL